MGSRLGGVVMRSSAHIPRLEISSRLLRRCEEFLCAIRASGLSVEVEGVFWVCHPRYMFSPGVGCSRPLLYHLWRFHLGIITPHLS